MNNPQNVLFSSASEEWATPQAFFDALNEEFHFGLDVCATPDNAKCGVYYTKAQDGLRQPWVCDNGNAVWCNPPYGRHVGEWVAKADEQCRLHHNVVVMLIPARTDTRYFHDYIYGKYEIRFVRGRLKFGDGKNPAPFPSMVVVFKG